MEKQQTAMEKQHSSLMAMVQAQQKLLEQMIEQNKSTGDRTGEKESREVGESRDKKASGKASDVTIGSLIKDAVAPLTTKAATPLQAANPKAASANSKVTFAKPKEEQPTEAKAKTGNEVPSLVTLPSQASTSTTPEPSRKPAEDWHLATPRELTQRVKIAIANQKAASLVPRPPPSAQHIPAEQPLPELVKAYNAFNPRYSPRNVQEDALQRLLKSPRPSAHATAPTLSSALRPGTATVLRSAPQAGASTRSARAGTTSASGMPSQPVPQACAPSEPYVDPLRRAWPPPADETDKKWIIPPGDETDAKFAA